MRQTANYCGPDTMQRSADQDFIEEMERVDCMKPRDDAHAPLSHSQVLPPGVHYEGAQAVRVHCWCEGGEWRGRQVTWLRTPYEHSDIGVPRWWAAAGRPFFNNEGCMVQCPPVQWVFGTSLRGVPSRQTT